MTTFKNNGKLKLLIIVGTRPEIIRLSAVIKKCPHQAFRVTALRGCSALLPDGAYPLKHGPFAMALYNLYRDERA